MSRREIYDHTQIDPQMSLLPEHDWEYIQRSVERVKMAWMFHHHMNPDGKKMLLAFSGGKDSICLFFVCKKAAEQLGLPMEQMFDVQYNLTCVDPPELVHFIKDLRKEYPFITIHHPKETMWQLIVKNKMPPTQLVRYCCSALKETSRIGGGYTLTGVRRAESANRSRRKGFEIAGATKKDVVFLGDNAEERKETEFCMQKNSYTCNPIIDWSDKNVWDFIHKENLPYCKLYDEGFHRLGCIGCPMGSTKQREEQFRRYPKYADCYKRAFQRMLDRMQEEDPTRERTWTSGEEVFHWWIYGFGKKDEPQEEVLFEQKGESK